MAGMKYNDEAFNRGLQAGIANAVKSQFTMKDVAPYGGIFQRLAGQAAMMPMGMATGGSSYPVQGGAPQTLAAMQAPLASAAPAAAPDASSSVWSLAAQAAQQAEAGSLAHALQQANQLGQAEAARRGVMANAIAALGR